MRDEGGRLEDLIHNEQDSDLKIHRKLMDAYGKKCYKNAMTFENMFVANLLHEAKIHFYVKRTKAKKV